jgi:hypothetical protein
VRANSRFLHSAVAGAPAPVGMTDCGGCWRVLQAFVFPTSRKVREEWGTLADLVPTNSKSKAVGRSARSTRAKVNSRFLHSAVAGAPAPVGMTDCGGCCCFGSGRMTDAYFWWHYAAFAVCLKAYPDTNPLRPAHLRQRLLPGALTLV